MKTAIELADEFPEQNPGNFEHDAALRLNDWGIEAHAMLRQQAEQIEALKADAERYRWLRALPIEAPQIGLDVVTWSNDDESTNSGVGIRLTELDAAIDAMKGKS